MDQFLQDQVKLVKVAEKVLQNTLMVSRISILFVLQRIPLQNNKTKRKMKLFLKL